MVRDAGLSGTRPGRARTAREAEVKALFDKYAKSRAVLDDPHPSEKLAVGLKGIRNERKLDVSLFNVACSPGDRREPVLYDQQ